MNVKRKLYERLAVPTALCGAETWSMTVLEKKILNVMEMRCLRNMDHVRNEVRRRIGWLSRAVCVEVVCTFGENGGVLVGDEKTR